jgi:hypothetical protein
MTISARLRVVIRHSDFVIPAACRNDGANDDDASLSFPAPEPPVISRV